MTSQIQIILIIGSILFFYNTLRLIKKSKLSNEMAIIWIVWGISVILISIFPEIVYKLTALVGIQSPMNAIFLFMIFFLYCLSFYLYLKLSITEEKLKKVIQEVAFIKKDIDDKK